MAEAPSSGAGDGGFGEAADSRGCSSLVDHRIAELAASGGAGAKYKAMSPGRLLIARGGEQGLLGGGTCSGGGGGGPTPGFSPSALLESPVLLNNMKVEPSPTTGAFINRSSTFNTLSHSDPAFLQREYFGSNLREDSRSYDAGSRPHLMASLQSEVSVGCELSTQTSMQGRTESCTLSSSHMLESRADVSMSAVLSQTIGTSGISDSIQVGTSTEFHQIHDSDKGMMENQDDHIESGPGSTILSEKSFEDGYSWRKYGQKHVKGSENPRSYYKCTHPSCDVKKLLERFQDGQIAQVVYKGHHNHPKPQANRRPLVGTTLSVEEKSDAFPTSEDKQLVVPSQSENHVELAEISEPPSGLFAEEDIETANAEPHVVDDVAGDDDLASKHRKIDAAGLDAATLGKANREPRVVVQTVSDVDILDDGYRWRKYGQKVVKGNPNPRSYYKCTYMGCPVRKHVERASHDPKSVVTTYEGKHNHEVPALRNVGHDIAAPTTRPAMLPINNAMPQTALGFLRAGGNAAPPMIANGHTVHNLQAVDPAAPISLDLGVGMASQNEPSAQNQIQYHQRQPGSLGAAMW